MAASSTDSNLAAIRSIADHRQVSGLRKVTREPAEVTS